ncbi:MAG: serine/threonine-protein kinase [Mycobacterium sp.]|uniref:serine/threonine-protein kinase n=1 Tax=Mycobacterium sp. TaxID=1785 RepID=UPI003BAF8566
MEGTPFGRYRLIELLGRGGMGDVWRAHDTDTDRIVAIKVLPAHLSADEDFQRRFRREAHAAAGLNSPHVIPIHHYGEIDGRLYVDMRLVEGRDLQVVLADGPLDPARAVRIIEQVAEALHAAHQVGLLHRDIKPSNILLDHNDFAYLIDFGIARAADETRMTKSGNTIGTFAYIAPERLDSTVEEDARADIYSLACVLYEALTGEPPFAGSTTAHLMYAHVHTPPPQPSTSQPNVPAQFDEVIATGMAKNPDNRYATTVELANAAHDAITTPLAPPAPPLLDPTRPPPAPPRLDDLVPPPPAPAPELARQQSVEPTQPATPQRPPGWPPAKTPTPSAKHPLRPKRSRRRMAIGITLVALAVLVGLAIGRTIIRNYYYVAAYNGAVSIMQGIQVSILGVPLHQPYSQGCLNNRNQLSVIRYGQAGGNSDCQPMKLSDLAESARAQVAAGLPAGTLEQADAQLRRLSTESLLPLCPPARAQSPPTSTPPPQPGTDCRLSVG